MRRAFKTSTNADLIKEIERLRKYVPVEHRYPLVVTPDIIQDTVCDYFSIDRKYMQEYTNAPQYVEPRQIAIYLCHTMAGISSKSELGRIFKRNHASIINTLQRVTNALVDDVRVSKQIEEIGEQCIDAADGARKKAAA